MPKIQKAFITWEEFWELWEGTWTPSAHTHIKSDITDVPWAWTDVLKTGSNLTDLATRQHAGLTNITSDQHHPQAHTLASHSTKPHSALTDVTANQHHAESHTLASHSTKPHSALTGVTADQHHPQAHTLASHSSKAHSELSDAPADAHHAQNHHARHELGGDDAIKLDDLAEPDNVIDLNSTTSRHGLFRKLSNNYREFLSGTGLWTKLVGSTGIAIYVLSKASANLRNSNDTERTTAAGGYTKVKEVQLGDPTGVMKIDFTLESVGGETVYGRIYKNGGAIGTAHSTTTVGTWAEDLGPFNSGDLIQIYAYAELEDTAKVRNMRFRYDRAITDFGDWEIVTPIITATQTVFNIQNQDP